MAVAGCESGYDRIIMTGGETSGQVMLSLKYNSFEIFESVAPGVPRMVPVDNKKLNFVYNLLGSTVK